MRTHQWWIARWLRLGIGYKVRCRYESDMIIIPYGDDIRSVLFFCYLGQGRFMYPTKQALPMIDLMQVGI